MVKSSSDNGDNIWQIKKGPLSKNKNGSYQEKKHIDTLYISPLVI